MVTTEDLRLPDICVATAEEVRAATLEAFELAEHVAERGYSYIKGKNEYRKFNAEIQAEQIALEAVCGLAKFRKHGIPLESATFRVVDMTDTSMMSLGLYRANAKAMKLDDPFSQGVLDYFRRYVSS